MTLDELYIDNKRVDIENVNIVRKYETPYFSAVDKLLADTTYTITLPQTENNKAIMDYLQDPDMSTSFPYTIHTADYFVEGLQLIRNGEVKVLGDFEIQIVFGINKAKYQALNIKKLNEIIPNGSTILRDDWIVNWNKTITTAPNQFAKYKYPYYISGERVRDVVTTNGITQPPAEPQEPVKSNMKEMTMHPFIAFSDILDLINFDNDLNIDFNNLKAKLTGKGLILNTDNVSSYSERISLIFDDAILPSYSEPSGKIELTLSNNNSIYEPLDLFNTTDVKVNSDVIANKKTIINLNCRIFDPFFEGVFSLMVRKKAGNNQLITLSSVRDGDYVQISLINYELDVGDIDFIYCYWTRVYGNNYNHSTITFFNLSISYDINKSFYGYEPRLGYYNCLGNLPKLSHLDFLKNALYHTGGFIGSDTNGDLKIFFFEDIVNNILNGNVYDWSGRISNVRNSQYRLGENAKKNWIKFNNDKELVDRAGFISVNDTTIAAERDLAVLDFDSPLGALNGIADFVLYEQRVKKSEANTVTFENKYVGENKKAAFVSLNGGQARNTDVIGNNYELYEKLVSRPIVKNVDVLLDFYESANLDFKKPIYINEWGKYSLLLELTASKEGLCEAKLLLINTEII